MMAGEPKKDDPTLDKSDDGTPSPASVADVGSLYEANVSVPEWIETIDGQKSIPPSQIEQRLDDFSSDVENYENELRVLFNEPAEPQFDQQLDDSYPQSATLRVRIKQNFGTRSPTLRSYEFEVRNPILLKAYIEVETARKLASALKCGEDDPDTLSFQLPESVELGSDSSLDDVETLQTALTAIALTHDDNLHELCKTNDDAEDWSVAVEADLRDSRTREKGLERDLRLARKEITERVQELVREKEAKSYLRTRLQTTRSAQPQDDPGGSDPHKQTPALTYEEITRLLQHFESQTAELERQVQSARIDEQRTWQKLHKAQEFIKTLILSVNESKLDVKRLQQESAALNRRQSSKQEIDCNVGSLKRYVRNLIEQQWQARSEIEKHILGLNELKREAAVGRAETELRTVPQGRKYGASKLRPERLKERAAEGIHPIDFDTTVPLPLAVAHEQTSDFDSVINDTKPTDGGCRVSAQTIKRPSTGNTKRIGTQADDTAGLTGIAFTPSREDSDGDPDDGRIQLLFGDLLEHLMSLPDQPISDLNECQGSNLDTSSDIHASPSKKLSRNESTLTSEFPSDTPLSLKPARLFTGAQETNSPYRRNDSRSDIPRPLSTQRTRRKPSPLPLAGIEGANSRASERFRHAISADSSGENNGQEQHHVRYQGVPTESGNEDTTLATTTPAASKKSLYRERHLVNPVRVVDRQVESSTEKDINSSTPDESKRPSSAEITAGDEGTLPLSYRSFETSPEHQKRRSSTTPTSLTDSWQGRYSGLRDSLKTFNANPVPLITNIINNISSVVSFGQLFQTDDADESDIRSDKQPAARVRVRKSASALSRPTVDTPGEASTQVSGELCMKDLDGGTVAENQVAFSDNASGLTEQMLDRIARDHKTSAASPTEQDMTTVDVDHIPSSYSSRARSTSLSLSFLTVLTTQLLTVVYIIFFSHLLMTVYDVENVWFDANTINSPLGSSSYHPSTSLSSSFSSSSSPSSFHSSQTCRNCTNATTASIHTTTNVPPSSTANFLINIYAKLFGATDFEDPHTNTHTSVCYGAANLYNHTDTLTYTPLHPHLHPRDPNSPASAYSRSSPQQTYRLIHPSLRAQIIKSHVSYYTAWRRRREARGAREHAPTRTDLFHTGHHPRRRHHHHHRHPHPHPHDHRHQLA